MPNTNGHVSTVCNSTTTNGTGSSHIGDNCRQSMVHLGLNSNNCSPANDSHAPHSPYRGHGLNENGNGHLVNTFFYFALSFNLINLFLSFNTFLFLKPYDCLFRPTAVASTKFVPHGGPNIIPSPEILTMTDPGTTSKTKILVDYKIQVPTYGTFVKTWILFRIIRVLRGQQGPILSMIN